MPEPEDAPTQPPADFVAWMSAEMPEVAASGRRIQRRHLRQTASRPARWRSVRRVRSAARVRGGDWLRWLIAAVVLVLAGWGLVAIVHPFGLGRSAPDGPPPAAAPVTSAPVPAAHDLFPAHVSFSGHTADRVATAADPDCRPGPGVPDALARVILDVGGCETIRIAEYVDLATGTRMVIASVEMSDPATTMIMPLRLTENFVGPSLLADPPAQTIFAGAVGCSETTGFAGSAAAVAGTQPDHQSMANETADLMRALTEPGCAAAPH